MAQLSLGVDRRTGKRRYIRRRAIDQKDADRKLARLQREWGVAGDVAFIRLGDYLAEWLESIRHNIAPATYVAYSGHVENHINPLLGHLTVGALHQRDVRRLINDRLGKVKSTATVVRIVATLRSALQQAVEDGELATNVARVKLPRVVSEPVEAMTPERAFLVLDAVKGDDLEALYVLLLGTGLRAGEACALDWKDVDLDAPHVFVRKGKTKSAGRVVPLPSFVVPVMKAHRIAAKRYGPDEPVFLGLRGAAKRERLRVTTVSHAFPKLLVRKGLPRMTVHQLRHAAATLMVAKGVPMRTVAEILGHANPSVTANVYAHVSQESKRAAIEVLDAALQRG